VPDVVILSDTHVPARARDLPAQLWAAITAADVVVHAGDWLSGALLDEVGARARLLVACVGNNDDAGVRAALPDVARAEIGGVRVAVLHDSGARPTRERRLAAAYGADTDLVVFGHSHIPWDSTVESAPGRWLRLLNPGSPTDRRRQPVGTWLSARFDDGRITGLRTHEVRRT
jgi:putative phosphoesterase